MRIISLSSAALPSLWALPVQALGPWVSRTRHLVKHLVKQVAQGDGDARVQVLSAKDQPASNEAVFAAPVRPDSTLLRAAPLRVVRESDSAIGAECAGRMVISGRMADVCAELDRMALRAGAAQDACITTRP
jgi:hypothetical protein